MRLVMKRTLRTLQELYYSHRMLSVPPIGFMRMELDAARVQPSVRIPIQYCRER